MGLLTDEIPSALGTIVIAAREGRLCSLDYGDCRDRMLASLARRYGARSIRPAPDPFGFSGRIRGYLAGDLGAIDEIPVEPGGTAFQHRVWAALRRIPAGTTLTYSELAQEIGRPSAVRAAGAANGQNPIAIVIPCHRVLGKDGLLTGYAGGLARKRWLLAHERHHARSGTGPHPGAGLAGAALADGGDGGSCRWSPAPALVAGGNSHD